MKTNVSLSPLYSVQKSSNRKILRNRQISLDTNITQKIHNYTQHIRQHHETDRPGVRQVPEGTGEQGKMEETGCEIICGAPTTLAVKG